jgi:hypothetical protein
MLVTAAGVVVLLAISAAVAYGLHVYQKRVTENARRVAIAAGLAFDPGDPGHSARFPFAFFGRGHSRRLRFTMWPPGDPDGSRVFEYRYTTGSGKSSRTWHYVCSITAIGCSAPHTTIATETILTRVGRFVGLRDIELESDRFNETFRVSSDDERFATALLDPSLMTWLLDAAAGPLPHVELLDGWALVAFEGRHYDDAPACLDWARRFRRQIPAVVASLYPPRAAG